MESSVISALLAQPGQQHRCSSCCFRSRPMLWPLRGAGPRRDTANFKALSVTESAELPPSLLQRDSESSGSSAMIEEAVLLRQALDRTLLPLGLYLAQNACTQEQLSPELTSLLTQVPLMLRLLQMVALLPPLQAALAPSLRRQPVWTRQLS